MRVWIVEIWNNANWEATVGAALCRRDGRIELKTWKFRNPRDKFRLRLYTRRGT